MQLPGDYWQTYDTSVDTLAQALRVFRTVAAYQHVNRTRFIWRGVGNAEWPLYSRLVRILEKLHGHLPTEADLQNAEKALLDEARSWNLDWHPTGGRLTPLETLAALQHHETPTRLIDFTFNPLIALWFAVDKDHDATDGRMFAIDISQNQMTRSQAASPEPWWFGTTAEIRLAWRRSVYVWRPPPIEARIVRQEACFLIGAMPSTESRRNIRVGAGRYQLLTAAETRKCLSVPVSFINYAQAEAALKGRRARGKQPTARAFTIRVGNCARIRRDLERTFEYSYRTLFPDFNAFARYGVSLALPGSP